jgi:hypothetical protein
MNITKKEICRYLQLAINKLLDSMEDSVELTEDLVATIPVEEWTDYKWFKSDKYAQPSVRSLYDDLQSLREIVEKNDDFFTFVDMDRLAALLNYISHTLNPPT